jgi:hypothetical protein
MITRVNPGAGGRQNGTGAATVETRDTDRYAVMEEDRTTPNSYFY